MPTILSNIKICHFIAATFILFSIFVQAEEDIEIVETIDQKLTFLLTTIDEKEKAIKTLKQKIKSEKEEIVAQQMQQQITNDEDIVRGMREQFISLSSGGEKIFTERKTVEKGINWQEDLEAIFAPIIERLKEISERPKRIEELEQEIIFWEKRSKELKKAVNNVTKTKKSVKNRKVKAEVSELLNVVDSRYESAGQKLLLLKSELDSISADKNPFWHNILELLKSFFSSMLYYLLIAIALGFLTFQLIVLIARIPKLMIDKKQPKRYVFAERTINLIKNIVGFSCAFAVYLIVLYSSGQWVLLVISLFLLFAIGLGVKNVIPKYFIEIKTLLNLGAIRQGERINFNGLPWKINLIDVHTHLHNPALDGHLRVPISELVNASSRPFHKDEQWFPTRSDDIVLLSDGTFGRVQHQSPDFIDVEFGGSIYSYPTTQFAALRPRNLSKGFTVYETFGIDYQHQADITGSILETYKDALEKVIRERYDDETCTYFTVEFDKAASSSLDFKVIAGFSGDVAMEYYKISRLIQKASVEIANQHQWVIPFTQITLHNAN